MRLLRLMLSDWRDWLGIALGLLALLLWLIGEGVLR